MVIDTVYVVSRTILFVYLVQNYPKQAINAFSLAQIASSVVLFFSYYGFFLWYISALNVKKQEHSKGKNKLDKKTMFSDMEDFPFTSIYEFLPGCVDNEVLVLFIYVFFINLNFLGETFESRFVYTFIQFFKTICS